jgi:hypothetical protein
MPKQFSLLLFLLIALSASAQKRILQGIITSRHTNKPIAGIAVYTYFTSTTTDKLGRYTLSLDSCRQCASGDRLEIYTNSKEFGGYETPCILNRDLHFNFSIPTNPDSIFVTGMVVNINNGTPLKNIRLRAFSENMASSSDEVKTNDFGIFKIPLYKAVVRNEKFVRIQPRDPGNKYKDMHATPLIYNVASFNTVYMIEPSIAPLSVSGYTKLSSYMIHKGDSVIITASGSVSFNSLQATSDPNGRLRDQVGLSLQQHNLVREVIYHASLLFRLGNNQPWQYAGKRKEFVADRDGYLEFEINDINQSNNKGAYQVEIKVIN